MKKMPRLFAAILAVGFAVGLAGAPVSTASAAAPQAIRHMMDTGWG